MYRIGIVNSSSFGNIFSSQMTELEKIGYVEKIKIEKKTSGKELALKLKKFNIIIASVTPIFDREFFLNKKDLLLITRHGIGYNNIDIGAAKEKGVTVSIVSPLVERDAVAENTVTNLLAVIRMTGPANNAAKNNNWEDRACFRGNNISGKTVGIIGCGNIGSRVAEIFRHGFNNEVIVYDPLKYEDWAIKHGIKYVDFDKLVEKSDIISLNCTLNPTSYEILNKKVFEKMKNGVYITNTARGALINEKDMCDAIEKGIVRGFATDVMAEEPSYNTHPYFKYENVLITPHISAYTVECLEKMGEKCIADIKKIIKGEIPEYTVTQ